MSPDDIQEYVGKRVTIVTDDANGVEYVGTVVGMTSTTSKKNWRRSVPAVRLREAPTKSRIIPLEDIDHLTWHPGKRDVVDAELPDGDEFPYTAEQVAEFALSLPANVSPRSLMRDLYDAGITIQFPPEPYYVEKDGDDWDVKYREAEDGRDLVCTFWHYFNDAEENAREYAEMMNAAAREA